MHEYSLVESLMEHVLAQAAAHRARAVRRVAVRIGELSGVEPDLLASAYDLVREGTICGDASLDVTRVPARWTCPACARPIAAGCVLRCAACGVPARLVEGDEILLERLDLEVDDV